MSFVSQYLSDNAPTFFEIVAQDRLIPSLKVASKYFLTIFAQRYHRLIPYLQYHEELFTLLHLIVENHHLSNHNSTFSEYLYGLMRTKPLANIDLQNSTNDVALQKSSSSSPLLFDWRGMDQSNDKNKIPKQHLISGLRTNVKFRRMNGMEQKIGLLFSVIVPYLKNKLDDFYRDEQRQRQQRSSHLTEQHQESFIPADSNQKLKNALKFIQNLFFKFWPYVNGIYEGTFFLYLLLYLFKKIPYYSPLLHLQGIILQRITIPEAQKQQQEIRSNRISKLLWFKSKGFPFSIFAIFARLGYAISDYSRSTLLVLVFLFKFLEWWYASENYIKQSQQSKSIHIPPPPKAPKRASGGVEIPKDVTVCPLCTQQRKNPTILSSSGFAFCYGCVHEYVSTYSRCPITHIPSTLAHMRRIFEQ